MKHIRVREQTWARVYKCEALTEQKGRCLYCKSPMTALKATAEHLVPKSKGGGTNFKNIKASCYDCNQTKGSLTDKQFNKLVHHPELAPTEWPARFYFLMANARWRINRRGMLAQRRIERAVS